MWSYLKKALVTAALSVCACTAFSASEPPKLTVLCYHDVVDSMEGADPDAVTTAEFSSQMMLLKTQGYNVISVQDYLDFKAGKKPLPPKAVMLTFDDGYKSYYTHVFPILRAMNFPSVLAVIGSWEAQTPAPGEELRSPVNNAHGKPLPLITPEQIKELSKSPLVEIASHSFDLHHGVRANTQGSEVPAAAARIYNGKYESEAEYTERLRKDLAKNSEYLKSLTGVAPRVMVWPYGRFTTQGLVAAEKTGHILSFGLDDFDYELDNSYHLGRLYVSATIRLSRFGDFVKNLSTVPQARRHHSVQITKEAFGSSGLSEQWLSGLVQSSFDSGASLISISPFQADNPCRPLFPVSGRDSIDILSKVFWQVQTRTEAKLLLDINLASCAFSAAEWEALTEQMFKLVPTHGIIVRGDASQKELVQRLLKKSYGTTPYAITGSNIEGLEQKFRLIQVDGCKTSEKLLLLKAQDIQYEVDSSRCDGRPVLESMLRSGLRNFGTFQGPLKADGKLGLLTKFINQGIFSFSS